MKKIAITLLGTILFVSCGNKIKPSKIVSVEPSEEILNANTTTDFSIVLEDMKIEEESSLMVHLHKYNVLKMIDDSLHLEKKDWATVNKSFFVKHKNDLGMEILSKHNNKISRVAQPVGFGWAIGNEAHGEWATVENDSTNNNKKNRRWRTHSTSPFLWYWLGTRRNVYRNGYSNYETNRSRGAGYYGRSSSGSYNYGTRSNYEKNNRTSFFTRRDKNKSRWNTLSKKASKNSSRYNNGSSTRSRSGGTGK